MRSPKLCLSLLMILAASAALPAWVFGSEARLEVDWVRTYGDLSYGMYNIIYRLDRAADGNLIIGGNTANYDAEGGLYYVAKTDLSGAVIWERDYGDGEGRWVAPAAGGGYLVAGWHNRIVFQTDALGNALWDARGTLQMQFANCVSQTSDGGAVACGSQPYDWTSAEMVARFDAVGALLWERQIGEGWSFRVLQAKDAGIVTAGTARTNCTRERLHVAKLDNGGDLQWEQFIAPKAARLDAGCANDDCLGEGGLVETADGGLVACGWGYIRAVGEYCGTVVKLDASGNVLWQTDLWGPDDHGISVLAAVALARDGGVLALGWTGAGGYLARLEADGRLAWEATVPECDQPRSVLESDDGGYLVAGADGPAARLVKVRLGLLPPAEFVRGDPNGDARIDISDAVYVLMYLFSARGAPLACADAADANDDGGINIADAVAVLSHLFAHRGPLPAPFDACGVDVTADDLDCRSFSPCE